MYHTRLSQSFKQDFKIIRDNLLDLRMGAFRMNHFLHCCMSGSRGSHYRVYQISSIKSRPKGNKWSCRSLDGKAVSETRLLRRKNNKSQDAQVTAYNSQHARGGTQRLRRLARVLPGRQHGSLRRFGHKSGLGPEGSARTGGERCSPWVSWLCAASAALAIPHTIQFSR